MLFRSLVGRCPSADQGSEVGVDLDLRPSVFQRALDGLKGGLFVRTELFILSCAQVVVGTDLVVSGADDGALARDVTGVPTVLSECLFVTNQRLGCEDGCRWTPLHPHTLRDLALKVCLHTFIDQHETSLCEIASWCEQPLEISVLVESYRCPAHRVGSQQVNVLGKEAALETPRPKKSVIIFIRLEMFCCGANL